MNSECGSKSDVEELDSCPADIDFLLNASAEAISNVIANASEKDLLREIIAIRRDDEQTFQSIMKKPGVVKLRRLDAFTRNTEMAIF